MKSWIKSPKVLWAVSVVERDEVGWRVEGAVGLGEPCCGGERDISVKA